jgi:Asp-tRNA(Asn)/Glu-tRNA(Gln) amidotransferase A subunit family amidase
MAASQGVGDATGGVVAPGRRAARSPAPVGSARDVAASIRSGRTTATEVAERTLAALERLEGDLRAMVAFDPELVLAQADALDAEQAAGRLRGPLHGVPFAVKDIADTHDLPTAHGSPIYVGNRPSRDAVVVERMRRAGAVVIGKTVTTEFACFQPGPTRNPHDLERTPGGSSSGSAALVGAGIVPLALATQTAGSVIRPAAFCGAVGVKPTYGSVPTEGVFTISPSLDTVGIIAHDVQDAALALGVMAGTTVRFDPEHADVAGIASAPLRLGWWPGTAPARLEEGVEDLLRAAALGLGDAQGLMVEELALPAWFGDLLEAQVVLMRSETVRLLERELREQPDLVSASLKAFLAPGPDADGARRALELRDRALVHLGDVFARFDAILTPAAPGEPPLADTTGNPDFCRTWTLLGTPAVVLPGLRGAMGLPLGLQLVGPRDADARTLAVALRVADAMRAAGLTLD